MIYKCGHDSSKEIIFVDGDRSTLSLWQKWKESFGWAGTKAMCFECYLKMLVESAVHENKNAGNF